MLVAFPYLNSTSGPKYSHLPFPFSTTAFSILAGLEGRVVGVGEGDIDVVQEQVAVKVLDGLHGIHEPLAASGYRRPC